MRTTTLICLSLLAASALAACDMHKVTADKIAVYVGLKNGAAYTNTLFDDLNNNALNPKALSDLTADNADVKKIKSWFGTAVNGDVAATGYEGKGCIKDDAAAKKMLDVISAYRKKIKSEQSLFRRALSVLPNMIANNDGCGKKESTLKLKKFRVFTKAKSSQQTINDIYKWEVKSKMVMMRIFKHVLTTVVSGQGSTTFAVK